MGRAFDTGSGFIALRVAIEGLPFEAVTDPAIAMPGDDDIDRVVGLLGESVTFSERIDPGTGKLQTDGMTVEIVEDAQHRFGDMFVRLPSKVAYLVASITSASGTVDISPPVFDNGDVMHLGTEAMRVVGGGGTTSLTVERGYRNTTPQAHFVDTTLGLPPAEITDRPVGLTGRRVAVYTYEPEDSVFGPGTLRWRGVCASDATQADPATWSILIDPPTTALDQDLSGDTQDGVQPRGIVYSYGCRLKFTIIEHAGSRWAVPGATEAEATFDFPASTTWPVKYESQAAFLDALNAAIIAATSGFDFPLSTTGPSLTAVEDGYGAWDLVYTPGATARYLSISVAGLIDAPDDARDGMTGGSLLGPSGAAARVVVSATAYRLGRGAGIAGAGTVPRGAFGYDGDGRYSGIGSATTLYLGGYASAGGAIGAAIEWPAAHGLPEATQMVDLASADATQRSITGTAAGLYGQPARFYTADSLPTIRLARFFAHGNVADLLNTIAFYSADNANAGRMPFVTYDDVDVAGMMTAADAITAGKPWVNERVFATYAKANLLEIVVEECKLMGAALVLTATGAVTLRELNVRAPTDSSSVAIGEDEILSGAGGEWPTFERQALGSLNTVVLQTGYNPATEKWSGRTFALRDLASFARQHTTRSIEIKPKSYFYQGDRTIDVADVTTLAQAYFGLLGAPYSIVQAKVPLTRFGVLIGDAVTVTSSVLPNPDTGGRGLSGVTGLVIGRKWEIMSGSGMLQILIPHQRVAGYSPTSRIASRALVSGTTYDLTLEAVQPGGYGDASCWSVGDTIKVREWDMTSPTQITGTVEAVNVGTRVIRVQLASAMSVSVWNLCYGAASVATASQQRYLYVADSDRQISFGTAKPARTLAA